MPTVNKFISICLCLLGTNLAGDLAICCHKLFADDFPKPYNSEPESATLLSPQESLRKIVLPAGFSATLFAHEPDVQNPIAMSFDQRGRLWIAENYTYAERAMRFDLKLRDRLLIFADNDGDGHAETPTLFTDELQMLTGVVVAPDGVWLMCPPKLLFIADRDHNDLPDGPPQEILDGFTVAQENYHNFANGLKLGHDGWLYGRCGASCPGEVGQPGSNPEQRVPLRGGLWRYHPERKIFESLNQGTTNPWGHDWNSHGEPFFINTVNGHLWHAIPGAHFVRPHSLDANRRAYELIDMHADHWHFDTGKAWTDSRDGAANSYGGGHAHIGCMIYQGGRWPDYYRDKLLTLNMHGRRINVDRLEREGSGYVGKHEPDSVRFDDPWFRGIELDYGPDGNVWVLDWSDTGECHDSTGVHRTSGRIYKLSYGDRQPHLEFDLAKATPLELADYHSHPNKWFVRQARWALLARWRAGSDCREAILGLRKQFAHSPSSPARLDALWTLNLLEDINPDQWPALLEHADEYVRTFAIRSITQFWPLDNCRGERPAAGTRYSSLQTPAADLLNQFVSLAQRDDSAAVRLALASTLQRLPVDKRSSLALELAARVEDVDDHNLPLMVWYGLIPVGDQAPAELVPIFQRAQSPVTRRLIARRLAEGLETSPQALEKLLTVANSRASGAADVITGLSTALAGWLKPHKPTNWDDFAAKFAAVDNVPAQTQLRQLNALFGDGRSLDELRKLVLDNKADMSARTAALSSLVDVRADGVAELCTQLLGTKYLNTIAVRGLARENSAALGEKMIKAYRSFAPLDRPVVIATLCTRAAWGQALLTAIDKQQIPREELNANHARSLLALDDAKVSEQLARIWGELRASPADKLKLIAELKEKLSSARAKTNSADPSTGKVVFKKVCGNCHKLYGEGGKIGPDLTGAQRQNLSYLLENIIDPSAVVTADFRMSTLLMSDGRVLAGIVLEKTAQRIVLQTQNEQLILSADEVEKLQASTSSLMPDGLLQTLTASETESLFAYLMTPGRLE